MALTTRQEKLLGWYNQLDSIRQLKENAEEEYGQYLKEFEEEFGTRLREEYEERHV